MPDSDDRDVTSSPAEVKRSAKSRRPRGRRRLHGVVVGVDRYRDKAIGDLKCARADALAVAAVLEERIPPSEREIHRLIDEEATKRAIVTAIGEKLARNHAPDDLVFLYFAGHGSPEHASAPDRVSRYLIPHDAEYDQIFATGIGLEQELTTLLERQRALRMLLVLDTCFSGQAGGRTFLGPVLRRTQSVFRNHRFSLRDLDLGYGRAVLAACGDKEVAIERDGHGIFTRHLLEVLTGPGDPVIPVGELYQKIHTAVVASTNGRQRPVFKGELTGLGLPRLYP